MIIVGSRKMAVYDDIAENKLVIYDKERRRAILGRTWTSITRKVRNSTISVYSNAYQVCGADPRRD
jgi:hypothetical protein